MITSSTGWKPVGCIETQTYAASVSTSSIEIFVGVPHPGRVPRRNAAMKMLNAVNSRSAWGATTDRYCVSHSTLGIATKLHVITPTHFIFCSFTFIEFLEIVPSAGRRHAPHLHVRQLAAARAGELGIDGVDADVRAPAQRQRSAREQRSVAQIGDGDQLDVELLVRNGEANEAVIARHPQRRVRGVHGAEGLGVVRKIGGVLKRV